MRPTHFSKTIPRNPRPDGPHGARVYLPFAGYPEPGPVDLVGADGVVRRILILPSKEPPAPWLSFNDETERDTLIFLGGLDLPADELAGLVLQRLPRVGEMGPLARIVIEEQRPPRPGPGSLAVSCSPTFAEQIAVTVDVAKEVPSFETVRAYIFEAAKASRAGRRWEPVRATIVAAARWEAALWGLDLVVECHSLQ